jgi:hypothetical protein
MLNTPWVGHLTEVLLPVLTQFLALPWGLSAPGSETYKSILLTEIQVVGAALVLIATGTLVVAQLAQTSTPRIFRSLPRRPVLLFFGPVVCVLALDVFSIILIPARPSTITHIFVNILICLDCTP